MRRMMWLTVMVLAVLSSTGQAQYGGGLPYIYYYDDYLKGTIIERVDGTDSRFVPYHSLEWSPSGQWFVDAAGAQPDWFSGGRAGRHFYSVRADGTRPIAIFQQKSTYNYRHKFPSHSDVLAIFDTAEVWIGTNRRWDAILRLINVSTGETLASFDITNFDIGSLNYGGERIYWQPGGLRAFFDLGKTIIIMEIDGSVSYQSKFTHENPTATMDKGFILTWQPEQPYVAFTITDLIGWGEFIFQTPASSSSQDYSNTYEMIWNEQRTYGLITGRACKYENYQRECHTPQTWVMDWISKQLYALSIPVNLSRDESGQTSLNFSPDGRYVVSAFFYGGASQPIIVDLENHQIIPHTLNGVVASLAWSDDMTLVMSFWDSNQGNTIIFDPNTQISREAPFDAETIHPSFNGEYWGLGRRTPVIVDDEGNVTYSPRLKAGASALNAGGQAYAGSSSDSDSMRRCPAS